MSEFKVKINPNNPIPRRYRRKVEKIIKKYTDILNSQYRDDPTNIQDVINEIALELGKVANAKIVEGFVDYGDGNLVKKIGLEFVDFSKLKTEPK